METLFHDLRYAVRMLVKSPAFAIVAVLTLALGIGANSAMFSLVNAVLLKPLPVHEPERLAIIGDPTRAHGTSIGTPRNDEFSYPLYRELLRRNTTLEDMAAGALLPRVALQEQNQPPDSEATSGAIVTGNYFSVLGVPALIGRTLTAQDDQQVGGSPVAVLGYNYWQRRFAGNPRVVGTTVDLNGYPFTIVGVLPPEFRGHSIGDNPSIYVPISMHPQLVPNRRFLERKDIMWLNVFGRMKPGITLEQVGDRTNVALQDIVKANFASDFSKDDQDNFRKLKFEVHPGAKGYSDLRDETGKALLVVMAIVGLVLLVACVNVATLLLARSSARRRELAVRLAIGAPPRRIVRQLLTESLLLAFLGGGVGMIVASWATQLLGRFILGRNGIQRLDTSVDLRVLAFTAGACLLTGVLFGLAPALQALRVELATTLKDAERGSAATGRWSASRVLIAAQMAIAVLVIVAAGLLVRTLQKLRTADLGYPRERLILMRLDAVSAGYKGARYNQLVRDLMERLRNTPGVRGVTASENGLFSGSESADTIKVEGYTPQKDGDRVSWEDTVAPDYFTTVGIPLRLGRDITADDTVARSHVAVVNEAFVKFYYGNENPIGRRFYFDDSGKLSPPMEIVGVARDDRDHGVRAPVHRRFYRPLFQDETFAGEMNFEIRTVAGEAAAMDSIRSAVRGVDPKLIIQRMTAFNEMVENSIFDNVMLARLSMTFGILAIVLGVIGLYGVMSYGVAGRTREIGVRMALGARRGDVLWMILREALTIAAVGIVVGVPLALAASRTLKTMLYGVAPFDPLPLAAAIVILVLVAALGGAIPARRATLVDPMEALRYE